MKRNSVELGGVERGEAQPREPIKTDIAGRSIVPSYRRPTLGERSKDVMGVPLGTTRPSR